MNEQEKPVIFIPFGATGDLMRVKVLPALFDLFIQGTLPKKLRVIGFSHRAMDTAGFRAHVREMVEAYAGKKIDDERVQPFLDLFDFVRGEFDNVSAYEALKQKIVGAEKELGSSANTLFYFSVAPQFYGGIAKALKEAGLIEQKEEAWPRVVIEKPFGTDGQSARLLEEALGSIFSQEQIYRIDHYLAKDAIDEILALRFPAGAQKEWGKDVVEHIRIELLEEIGVEKRGAFYDPLGAFRDVGQNHILETLAFLTMDAPGQGAQALRQTRAHALQSLPILSEKEIARQTFRAQYEGYTTIPNVAPHSQTETYYKIALTLTSPRWEGVRVVMESGKRMGPAHKAITLTLRSGKLVIISLESRTRYTGEYARLLAQAFVGDQTRFISSEEVAAMWRFSDPILASWRSGTPPLHIYPPDTKDIIKVSKSIERQ